MSFKVILSLVLTLTFFGGGYAQFKSMNDTPVSYLEQFRNACIISEGKYLDQKSEFYQPLQNIGIYLHNKNLFIVHIDDYLLNSPEEILTFNPLIIHDNQRVSNILSEKRIHRRDVRFENQRAWYDDGAYLWVFSYQQFITNKLTFSLSNHPDLKFIYQRFEDLLNDNMFITHYHQRSNDFYNFPILIKPLIINDPLYSWLLNKTAGYSRSNLQLSLKLTKINGELYYYINRIVGFEWAITSRWKVNSFEIEVKNGKFKVITGSLDSLRKVLDTLPSKSCDTSYYYEERNVPKLTQIIHNWVLNGCPEIPDLTYDLHLSETISLKRIITPQIIIEIGENNLWSIIDRNTGDNWYYRGERIHLKSKLEYRTCVECSNSWVSPPNNILTSVGEALRKVIE